MPKDNLLSGKVLIAQVIHQINPKKRLELARLILDGASFNMIKNLKYYNSRGKELKSQIIQITTYRERLPKARLIDELMGLEGNMRKCYYEAFDLILNDYFMEGRSYQPPRNEVNALISFGNMMCYSQCLKAIHQTQLNPLISFLHEPGERRYSMSLDLAEIFKPILVDRVIFRVLNKKEIQKNDFEPDLNRILLKDSGRKTFVKVFEERLNETIQHRTLKRNVSYKYLIRLECYKILKHIMGIEKYKPLKMYW
jgi:CRISPR-associated protein Cas1